jgi:hypothetical protein
VLPYAAALLVPAELRQRCLHAWPLHGAQRVHLLLSCLTFQLLLLLLLLLQLAIVHQLRLLLLHLLLLGQIMLLVLHHAAAAVLIGLL